MVTTSSQGGGVNYRFGSHAIPCVLFQSCAFHRDYELGNKFTYLNKMPCQQNCRSNKLPIVCRSNETGSSAVALIAFAVPSRPLTDPHPCDAASGGADLRKGLRIRSAAGSGRYTGPRSRFCAVRSKKSKFWKPGVAVWSTGGASTVFAQLRRAETAAERSATPANLLTQPKRSVHVASTNQQDRFWT